jgi:hypothetical protein
MPWSPLTTLSHGLGFKPEGTSWKHSRFTVCHTWEPWRTRTYQIVDKCGETGGALEGSIQKWYITLVHLMPSTLIITFNFQRRFSNPSQKKKKEQIRARLLVHSESKASPHFTDLLQ